MHIDNKARSFLKRLKNREFGYLAKRIFPGGNIVFYMGRQLVFRLYDYNKFKIKYEKSNRNLPHEIMLADKTIIDELCHNFPDNLKKFKNRFERGDKCYVTRLDKIISGYLWIKESPVFFDTNSMWQFKPSEMDGAWFFDVFVVPEYRRKGLFSFMLWNVYNEYAQRGHKTLYSETAYSNDISIASHLDLGFYIYRDVRYISMLGLKLYLANEPLNRRTKINCRYILNVAKYKL